MSGTYISATQPLSSIPITLSKGSDQFSSVAQSCPTLCDPMNRSTSGFPVYHQLLEFTHTSVHRVRDAIQPPHPLSSPSPPAPNPSQHQSLFQWVNSLHEVGKLTEYKTEVSSSLRWLHRALKYFLVFMYNPLLLLIDLNILKSGSLVQNLYLHPQTCAFPSKPCIASYLTFQFLCAHHT